MQVIIVIILILAVLLVIFTLQNSMDITLNVLFWEIQDAPLVLILIACLLTGYLIATIYFSPRLWKVKKEYSQLIKFNEELKQLHDLNKARIGEAIEEDDEETDPEGMVLDEDDNQNSFFRD